MADETTETTEQATATEEEPDYKALYEEAKAKLDDAVKHSRTWEKRAKAKPTATDAEKSALEEVADLKRQLAAEKVANAKHVPASMLHGATEDEMNAEADAINKLVDERAKLTPVDLGGAAASGAKPTTAQQFAALFK